MRLAAVKNVEFEDLGTFKEAFNKRGVETLEFEAYDGNFPEPKDFDLLVVLGGPMGVYEEEEYPFLKEEKELIKAFYQEGKKILGICLGCQLLAELFGGKVYKGEWGKEIGWKPIYPQMELELLYRDALPVFHWHGDTFTLPKGAVKLASSAMYKNQAFRIGRQVVGLQFHLEVEPEGIKKWIENYRKELEEEGITPEEILATPESWRKLKIYGDLFVEFFLKL